MRCLAALDRNRRVAAAPFQNGRVRAATGLSLAECEAAAWAVAAGGRRYRGAAAINAALAVALGTGAPLWLYHLSGIRQAQDRVYAWVVANRSRFPGDRPYCQQYPAHCE